MSAAPVTRPNPLDQAFRLRALGLSVIPLRPRDKKPSLTSWTPFQATPATEDQLRKWFSDDRRNLGIVTGAVSGVVVVDADNAEAERWMQAHHPSPMTTRTSKGRHFFFKHPGVQVHNGAKLRGMALDVRGDGGYVVAPGSIHPNGGLYLEEGVWDTSALPVFDISWLREAAAPAPAKPTATVQPLLAPDDRLSQAMRYMASVPAAVQGEAGDAHTFRLACKLVRGFDLTDEQALGLMNAWNQTCTPPWSEAELVSKVQTARANGTEPFGARLKQQTPREPIRFAWMDKSEHGAPGQEPEPLDAAGVRDLLAATDKGKPIASPGNLAKILRHDRKWARALTLNQMSQEVYFDGAPAADYLTDYLQEWVEDQYMLRFGREEVAAKVLAQATLWPFHPVREYLEALEPWDGVERIHRLPAEVLHAEDQPMNTQYLLRWFVGAVRRVLEPGCKLDTALVLSGPQGYLKSTFFAELAGEWFGDSPVDLDSKDGFMVLHRRWITELGEIDHTTSTRSQERIKAFLSSREDIFRPPFGRTVCAFPRSCVMVGSSNPEGFLHDPTGSRRFWPLRITRRVDVRKVTAWRDQLWAEALNLCRAGVDHWLSPEMDQLRSEGAKAFEVEDPWCELLDTALGAAARAGHLSHEGFALGDLLTGMGIPQSQQTRAASMRLAAIVKARGWQRRLDGLERRARWHTPPE